MDGVFMPALTIGDRTRGEVLSRRITFRRAKSISHRRESFTRKNHHLPLGPTATLGPANYLPTQLADRDMPSKTHLPSRDNSVDLGCSEFSFAHS